MRSEHGFSGFSDFSFFFFYHFAIKTGKSLLLKYVLSLLNYICLRVLCGVINLSSNDLLG